MKRTIKHYKNKRDVKIQENTDKEEDNTSNHYKIKTPC